MANSRLNTKPVTKTNKRCRRQVLKNISNTVTVANVASSINERPVKRPRKNSSNGTCPPPLCGVNGLNNSSLSEAEVAAEVCVVLRTPRRSSNPALCLDTVQDMHQRWKESEGEYSPMHSLALQRDVSYVMRAILIDWLVEIHYKKDFDGTTLWLSINLLDRYLANHQIMRDMLQLVGVASFLIAVKFSETYPIGVKDCVELTNNSFTTKEVLYMETKILEALDYQISIPTGFHFITHYLRLIDATETMSCTALFVAERSLQEELSVTVLPSHYAAAAVLVAIWKKEMESHNPLTDAPITASAIWPDSLREASGFTGESLMPCARNLILHAEKVAMTSSQRHLIAAKKKYYRVARLRSPEGFLEAMNDFSVVDRHNQVLSDCFFVEK